MKKLIALTLILVLVSSMAMAYADVYGMTVMVCDIDEDADLFYAIDFSGYHGHEFDEVEDWMIGDLMALVMDDMGTEDVCDDEVISYQYSGWVDPDQWMK